MKKYLCLLAIAFLFAISCTSDGDSSEGSSGFLKQRLSGGPNGRIETYYYNGSKLDKVIVSGSSQGIAHYHYDGNLISKIEHLINGGFVKSEQLFFYNEQQRLIRFERHWFSEEGNSSDREITDYTFQNDTTMSFVSTYGGTVGSYAFNSQGEIIEHSYEYDNGYGESRQFTYDNSPSPYSQITGYDKIAYADNHAISYQRNIATAKITLIQPFQVNNINYTSTFNAEGFPLVETGYSDLFESSTYLTEYKYY